MKNRITISEYLRKDKNQRRIYGGILLLWIFVGLNFVKYKYDSSPFRIDMLLLIIISNLMLIGPIFLNKKILWFGAFGFALLHGLWTVYKILFDLLPNFQRDYVENLPLNLKDIGTSVLLIVISFLVTWIIWKMKPSSENSPNFE